jgi:hypothetical protein
MQLLQRNVVPPGTVSSLPDDRQFYSLCGEGGGLHSVLYRVIPAGKNFFHILEVPSGRIKGFRSDHNQACKLAKQLEAALHTLHG